MIFESKKRIEIATDDKFTQFAYKIRKLTTEYWSFEKICSEKYALWMQNGSNLYKLYDKFISKYSRDMAKVLDKIGTSFEEAALEEHHLLAKRHAVNKVHFKHLYQGRKIR